MAAKRGGTRKGSSDQPTAHDLMVLLEDMNGKLTALREGQVSSEARLKQEIDSLRQSLSSRIDVLELAIRQNSADIRQNSADIKQNSADIKQNSKDILELRAQLAELTDVVRGKVDVEQFRALQDRVARLETRLGL